jgi:signal transduction histidine kinase
LEEATNKQAETESKLSTSRARKEQLSKELQEAQQAAAAAAEESKATIEGLEQQLAEAQEAQVCGFGPHVEHCHHHGQLLAGILSRAPA